MGARCHRLTSSDPPASKRAAAPSSKYPGASQTRTSLPLYGSMLSSVIIYLIYVRLWAFPWRVATALYSRVSRFESRRDLQVFGPLFALIKRSHSHPRCKLLVLNSTGLYGEEWKQEDLIRKEQLCTRLEILENLETAANVKRLGNQGIVRKNCQHSLMSGNFIIYYCNQDLLGSSIPYFWLGVLCWISNRVYLLMLCIYICNDYTRY